MLATGSGPTRAWTRDHEIDTVTCSTPKTVVVADDDDGEICDASCSLREAVNAVLAAGSGTVIIPPGTYDVATPIGVPAGITIRGAGARSTIVRSTTGATVLETGRPAYSEIHYTANSKLSDVTLECVDACTSAPLSVHAASGIAAERIRIVDTRVDAAPAIAGEVNLRDSTILMRGGGGITSPASAYVENTTIAAPAPTGRRASRRSSQRRSCT